MKKIKIFIKGLAMWTVNIIEMYFSGLKDVCLEEKYWDCRQTFFKSEADRKVYADEEEKLIERLRIK